MSSSQPISNASASFLKLDHNSYKSIQHGIEKAIESPIETISWSFLLLAVIWLLRTVHLDRKTIPGFPIVGQSGPWDILRSVARYRWICNGEKVVKEGQAKYGEDGIFQVTGHSAPYLVIPIKYMNELRNNRDLSQPDAASQDLFGEYKPFHLSAAALRDPLVAQTVLRKLNPMLSLLADPVNEECNIAIPKRWPASSEWKEHLFVDQVQSLVAQVSSRVFLGAPLCRDEEWLKIAVRYTIDLMIASFTLQFLPRQLRGILHRFLPPVTQMSRTVEQARTIIGPEIQQRKKNAADALAKGEKAPQADSIDWMIELSGAATGTYDVFPTQIMLTFAAVHTTSITMTHLLYDIIENELVDELREELISVYREHGQWSKASLQKLQLLDSVMKESARFNPLTSLAIHRYVCNDITLSNGAILPKGTRFVTPSFNHTSEQTYKNATTFDAKRFLKMKDQPGNAAKYQFVSPSAEHTSFGLGIQACPGRFFASQSIKLMIAHLLLEYDWKFVDKRPPNAPPFGGTNAAEPTIPIMYKSRTPEIVF